MATQFERYRATDRTRANPAWFNGIFKDIDLRVATLEDLKISWEAAVADLRVFGLAMLNVGVQPLLDQLIENMAAVQVLLDALPDDVALKSDLAEPSNLVLTRVDGLLSIISETINANVSTTTLFRDVDGRISSTRRDYLGVRRTETLIYNPDGSLYGFTATEVPL